MTMSARLLKRNAKSILLGIAASLGFALPAAAEIEGSCLRHFGSAEHGQAIGGRIGTISHGRLMRQTRDLGQ